MFFWVGIQKRVCLLVCSVVVYFVRDGTPFLKVVIPPRCLL